MIATALHKPVALAGRQRRSSVAMGSDCRGLASKFMNKPHPFLSWNQPPLTLQPNGPTRNLAHSSPIGSIRPMDRSLNIE